MHAMNLGISWNEAWYKKQCQCVTDVFFNQQSRGCSAGRTVGSVNAWLLRDERLFAAVTSTWRTCLCQEGMVRGDRTVTEIQFFPASICYMNMIYLMTILSNWGYTRIMVMYRMTVMNWQGRGRSMSIPDLRFIHSPQWTNAQSEEGRFPVRDLDPPSSLKVPQVLPIRTQHFVIRWT